MAKLSDDQKKKVTELLTKGLAPMKVSQELALDKFLVYNIRKKLVAGKILKPLHYRGRYKKKAVVEREAPVVQMDSQVPQTKSKESVINFTVNNTTFVVHSAKRIVITPTGVDIQS